MLYATLTRMNPDLSSQELSAWIRLSLEPGLGAASARSLLAAIGLPQDIYAAPRSALSSLLSPEMAQQLRRPASTAIQATMEQTLKWLAEPSHHVLTLADPGYPKALLDIHDPPLLLYVNGQLSRLALPAIAIVGARNATSAGLDNAMDFAQYLAQQGWCIASGLALGIDTAAHRGALRAAGSGAGTIAILGTGIDIVYPSRNRDLAHQIAEHGALLTEFPLGTHALPHQFPKRNRIVAGLARGVLVVEAAKQSGSLITARLATDMGREVFAIPGSIHSPLSRGCHALIRQGAKLVESAHDIHEELGLPNRHGQKPDPATHIAARADRAATRSANAGAVLEALGYDPVHLDTLLARTRLDLPVLTGELLKLELDESVARLDDGRFQRRSVLSG